MSQPAPVHELPPEYSHSYADLGVFVQPGTMIEVRAPRSGGTQGVTWPSVLLDINAARKLLEWLPGAIEMSARGIEVAPAAEEGPRA
jgi:hypothetical protein